MALLSSVMVMSASGLAQDALEEAPGKTDLPDVADRYEGTGYHAGSFWLLPTLETGIFYDSNVKAESSNADGSLGAYVIPRLELNSDWGRHALNFAVQAEEYLYFDESFQDRTNVFGEMDTRIDIQRDLVFAAGMKGGLFEEQVGDFNTAYYADEPTEYVDVNTWASLNKAFNRLRSRSGSPTTIRTMMMSSRSLAPHRPGLPRRRRDRDGRAGFLSGLAGLSRFRRFPLQLAGLQ